MNKEFRVASSALALSAGISVALFASPACGQTTATGAGANLPDNAQSSAPVTAGALPSSGDPTATQTDTADIVVTARKVRESALQVPISISSVSGEQLAQRHVVTIEDLVPLAPSFTFARGATGTFRTMRGGGSTGSSFSFEQSTGLFIDNVSYGRNEQGRLPIFDIENIDILRGPQVITFGNSTTAGAIAVTTKKPGDSFEADLSSSYEFNNRETTLRGGITVPVSPKLSVRVSGYYDGLDKGWVKNIYGGSEQFGPNQHDWAGRVVAVAQPVDGLKVTLKYEHDTVRSDGTNLVPISNPTNSPLVVVRGLVPLVERGAPAPFNVPTDRLKMDQDTYFAQVEYDLGFGQVTSTSNYWTFNWAQGVNASITAQAVSFYETRDRYREFSNETRLSGNILPTVSYLAGVYYVNGTQNAQTVLSLNQAALGVANPAPPFSRVTTLNMRVATISAFADATWQITDKLQLEPGVRYSRIRRHGDQALYSGDVITGTPNPAYSQYVSTVAGGVPHDFQGLTAPESHVQPQAVLSYRQNQNLNFFARFVEGAKAGGIDWTATGSNPTQAIFAAEQATDYEVGFKSRLFDRRVSVDLTLFNTDYSDLQVSTLSLGRFAVTNAGGSRSRGAELVTSWRPVAGLSIGGTLAYLDARYRSFRNGACTVQQSLTLPSPCTRDLSGLRTPFSSKWSAAAHVEYAYDVGPFLITPSVDGNFRSPFNASPNDDPLGSRPSLFLLDARIQLTPKAASWNLAISGKNLTNRRYTNFVSAGGPTLVPGITSATLERLRQIAIQFDTKF